MKKLNLILAAFVLALIGFTSCDEKIDTTVHVEGIEITAPADEAITMKVGETQTLTIVVTPDNAEDKTFSTVSSDASVVSVDEANLVIKAEKEGTATITVTTLEEQHTFTDVINVTVVKEDEPDIPVEPELLAVELGLVEARAKDVAMSVTFPEGWPEDPMYPGDNHPIMFGYGEKSEIGSLTDEELLQRDYAALLAEAELYDMTNDLGTIVGSHQFIYADYNAEWPLMLSGTYSVYRDAIAVEPNTEYLIYAYALSVDANNEFVPLSGIARLEAATIDLQMVELDFTFGIDRVSVNQYGELMAYFGVEADNAAQRFTFYSCPESELVYYSEDGVTIPTLEEVAEELLQYHINSNNNSWMTNPLEEWTYFGYGCDNGYSGALVSENPEENKWCVVAGALDEDLNIVSEVGYDVIDVTGLVSTDAVMNLEVAGEQGVYTYSVNPTETPYLLTVIAVDEMEKYLMDNYYYDYDVVTYIDAILKEALATSTVEEYLAAEGMTSPVNEEPITVEKDTYLIAYTIYEKSGIANGIEYELLEASVPEATEITLTDADGVNVDFSSDYSSYVFNFKWNDGIIRFLNNDGEWSDEVYDYTHTGHIVLGQEYSSKDDEYMVNLEYTYLGDPDDEYAADNLMSKRATLIVEDNGDGTYTVTADVVYKDQTHHKYIYTGAIDDEVINGRINTGGSEITLYNGSVEDVSANADGGELFLNFDYGVAFTTIAPYDNWVLDGTYTIQESLGGAGTAKWTYDTMGYNDPAYYVYGVSGTMTISYDADGCHTVKAEVLFDDGETRNFSFYGYMTWY